MFPPTLTQLIEDGKVPLDYGMNLLDSSALTADALRTDSVLGTPKEESPILPFKSLRPVALSATPFSLEQLIIDDVVPLVYAINLLDSSAFTANGDFSLGARFVSRVLNKSQQTSSMVQLITSESRLARSGIVSC